MRRNGYNLRGAQKMYNRFYSRQIRSIKRQIDLNKGEIKRAYFNANAVSVLNNAVQVIDLTGIAQGTEDDERLGRKIRLLRIDLRIHLNNRNLDCYLIQGQKNTLPTFSDFDSSYAAHLVQNARYEFKELKYIKEQRSQTNYAIFSKRWKNGISVIYDGPAATDGFKNCMFLVFRNTTGATIGSNQYSAVVTYRE